MNENIEGFHNTVNELDITDIYRTLHPTIVKHKFLLGTHETFSRIDNILAHKIYFNKPKRLKSYKLCYPTTMG